MSDLKEYLITLKVSDHDAAGVVSVMVVADIHKEALAAARARIVGMGLRPGEIVKARQRVGGFNTAWEPVEADATGGLRI